MPSRCCSPGDSMRFQCDFLAEPLDQRGSPTARSTSAIRSSVNAPRSAGYDTAPASEAIGK